MAEIGSVIDGKYEILTEIGHGGMSVVYLAMDTHLNKQWAVKEIKKKGSGKNDEIVVNSLLAEANREDCSKNSRVLKAHKYSIFGNLLSIRKMQDVGISRPICCYTSKLIRKKEIEQAIFIYNLISTRKAAFLTPTQENRNAAFFMPSCYAVRANKALIYAALRARK